MSNTSSTYGGSAANWGGALPHIALIDDEAYAPPSWPAIIVEAIVRNGPDSKAFTTRISASNDLIVNFGRAGRVLIGVDKNMTRYLRKPTGKNAADGDPTGGRTVVSEGANSPDGIEVTVQVTLPGIDPITHTVHVMANGSLTEATLSALSTAKSEVESSLYNGRLAAGRAQHREFYTPAAGDADKFNELGEPSGARDPGAAPDLPM
jgi:hypothetical protein